MTPLSAEDEISGYDVIGDVHGHLVALEGLLSQLGYVDDGSGWAHPSRRAVFIGDLIDRGAHQVEVVRTVQQMVARRSAHAVMGNHEFNAIAYHLPDPASPGHHCRVRSAKNKAQHAAFLEQVGEDSPLHREMVEWFLELPLWIELSLGDQRLRIVHACWHQPSMQTLEPWLSPAATISVDGVVAASKRTTAVYDAVETLLKGPEVHLGGRSYLDKGGHERHRARRRWWDPAAATLDAVAHVPPGSVTPSGAPFGPLPDVPCDPAGQYLDMVPLVVGHYWCRPPLDVWSPFVACVDFSVAADGPLVAYRWSGEASLAAEHYVAHWAVHPAVDDIADVGESD